MAAFKKRGLSVKIESLIYSDNLWKVVADYAQGCSWRAGTALAKRMKGNHFSDWERVFAAIDGDQIAGFCTLTKTDCIPDIAYKPYIGFIFVGEQY
jgi:hypothetical protein